MRTVLFLLAGSLLSIISPTTWSYQSPSATANPCKEMFRNQRSMRHFPRGYFIYNGFDNLSAAPRTLIGLNPQFTGPNKAGCVVFQGEFAQSGNGVLLRTKREVFQYPARMSSMTGAFSREAGRVLDAIGDFSILPQRPNPGMPYLIAIPLYEDHPFYKGGSGAGIIDDDMKARGYPNAKLVAKEGETRVFHLFTRGNQDIFAVIKRYGPDEKFLDTVETGEKNHFNQPILRYGDATMAEFNRLVAPHTRARGTLLAAEVRYYAIGEKLDYPKRPGGAPAAVHPKTHRPVLAPVAIGLFQSAARGGKALGWVGGRLRDGADPLNYPTLAALRSAYEEENVPEEEQRRRAAEAAMRQRAQYAPGEIPEHLWTMEEHQQAARAKIRAAEAARKPGFVYKSDAFWKDMPDFYIPQKTFEGEFVFQIRKQFPAHFLMFLTLYSERCSDLIHDGKIDEAYWEEVTMQGNREISRIPHHTSIKVESSFWPKYREYKALGATQDIGDMMNLLRGFATAGGRSPATQSLSQLDRMIGEKLNGIKAWAAFFNKASCTSATMMQMKENLLRAANGLPSIQKQGATIPNAAEESESLIVPPERMTFFDGCHDYFLYEKRDYCTCLSAAAEKSMTPEELKAFAQDFARYADEVMVVNSLPSPADPYWRLSEPQRACSK